MKKLILCGLLFASQLHAGSIRLAWDASPTSGCTYKLYAHTNSLNSTNLTTALVSVNVGTNLTVLIDQINTPAQWYFVATANLGGAESNPSNQLMVQFPVEPAGNRVVIQGTPTITVPNTWTNLGLFRLMIGP